MKSEGIVMLANPMWPAEPDDTVTKPAGIDLQTDVAPLSEVEIERRDKPKPKPFQLGVLFVHGMGTQPARNTLVQWSDELLKTIEGATQNQVVSRVERAWPGDGSAEKCACAAVVIRANGHEESWLFAEGWWADTFPAPSYRELVSWSVRAVPWAIAIHIAQRYWQTAPETSRRRKFVARTVALLQLFLALALAPLFIVLLALTLLLGLLPIPQLRTVILSAQSVLTGTIGDNLAFVESPLRAALIRTRILDSLERLIDQCEHTMVVAHSQGAAAVLDALGGIADFGGEIQKAADQRVPEAGPVPDTLVTFGAGINQLVSLKVLSRGLPRKLGVNPAYFGVGSLLATVVAFAWLFAELLTGRTTIPAMLHSATVLAVALAVGSLLFLGAKLWTTKHPMPKQASHSRKIDIAAWMLVITTLVIVGIAYYYADRNDLPLGAVGLLGLSLLMSAASVTLILSRDMREVVTAPVQEPLGLARWVDLHASADPVPNGPTRIENSKILTSIPIWNQGSIFTDHTTYWQNLDGFTLRVARLCAETAVSPWLVALPPETAAADQRAAWRVGFLRLARWITRLAWLFTLSLLWKRHGQIVPLPFDLPTWVPSGTMTAARWALLALLVAAAAWVTSRLLFWPWAIWVRAEQREVLAHSYPKKETPWAALVSMGIVVGVVLLLALSLARTDWWTVREAVDDPRKVLALAPLLLGGGMMLAFFARWLMPAPPPADVIGRE